MRVFIVSKGWPTSNFVAPEATPAANPFHRTVLSPVLATGCGGKAVEMPVAGDPAAPAVVEADVEAIGAPIEAVVE